MNRNTQEFFGWLFVIFIAFMRLYNYANGCGVTLECEMTLSGMGTTFMLMIKLGIVFLIVKYFMRNK